MLRGNPSVFAIESSIDEALPQKSLMALGHYVLHVGGRMHGVFNPRATLLACSFDAVQQRIRRRGMHTASFAGLPALEIARLYLRCCYGLDGGHSHTTPCDCSDFQSEIELGDLVMAPDGDAAFDDGSHVLQFDLAGQVRVIAFKNAVESLADPASIKDVVLDEATFYGTLASWGSEFSDEWRTCLESKAARDL